MPAFEDYQIVDLYNPGQEALKQISGVVGDTLSHVWTVEVRAKGAAADLTGCTASVAVRRFDGLTVPVTATISGNVVRATLPAACFEMANVHIGLMLLQHSVSGMSQWVASCQINVAQGETDVAYDPAAIVPSLSAILALMESMQTAEAGRVAAEAARSLNATNLRVGGNFPNTTGVTAYQITATAANNKLRLVATATGEHWSDIWGGSGLTAGHTYYARVKVSGVVGIAAVEMINRLSSGSYTYSGKILPNASGVASLTMAVASLYSTPYTSLRVELANASGSYNFTAGTEEASFEYLTVLDLTAIFGAGYEPTAAQMDAYLAYWSNSWFEGTANLAMMTKAIPALLVADRGLTPQVSVLNQLIGQGYDTNLLNVTKIISGYYINASGVPTAMSGIAYSDYNAVIPGERYAWYNVSNADSAFSACGAYYDSNKAFLSSVSGTEGETVKHSTAPAGAAYLRINIGTSKTAAAYLKRMMKSRWLGKTMVVIGDSITYGYSLSNPSTQNWARIVSDRLGCSAFTNYGVSGSKLAPSTSDGSASYVARYSAMDSTADLVLVFISTNDYGSSSLVPMSTPAFGSPSDRTDASYYGALHVLFSGLLAKYPSKRVVAMTPIHRTALSGATGDDYVVNPDTGKCLQDYVDAAKAVARYYGIEVLDLFAESGAINPNIAALKSAYMPDGLHPNFAGHLWIADRVIRHL